MSAVAQSREVMLIEDDFAIRETLRELLEEEGYRVSWAANGQEALIRLKSGGAPALILLDLRMPVMDGCEFRRVQQRDPQLSSIPVVVISADHFLHQQVSDMSVEGVLAKPFDLSALLETVQRCCGAAPRYC